MQPLATSVKIELANSLSHGFGVLFGIIAIPVLISFAAIGQDLFVVLGCCIFGFSFLMTFAFSTLYHGFKNPEIRRVMRILDHISIYFLIAGTYTPFILIYYFNTVGIILLCVLWGLTLLGIIFKTMYIGRFEKASLIIYLSMGWIVVFAGKNFFTQMDTSCIAMLIGGGVLYTLGVIFYRWESMTYHHFIWHLFVLGGAMCHYAAVLISVSS